MKAMVLAAGFGTRLRPITDRIPKPAVPFFGRPILQRTLDVLATVGVEEAIVNAHHHAARIQQIAAQASLPVRVSLEEQILGTGGALAVVRDELLGEEAFFLANGDMVFDLPLAEAFVAHRASDAGATLIVIPNPDPLRYSRIVAPDPYRGQAEDPHRTVRSIEPRGPGPGFLYTGIAVITGRELARFPDGPSELLPTLLAPLAREGRLAAWVADGLWYEMGTPADLLAAHLDVLRRVLGEDRKIGRIAEQIVDQPMIFDRDRRSAIHPTATIDGDIDEVIAGRDTRVETEGRIRRSLLLPGAIVSTLEADSQVITESPSDD